MRVLPTATHRALALVLLLLLAAIGPLVDPARAQIEDAPLLVADLDTGAVIFERNGTMPWYPASLTKIMTAYVALDAVRRGRLSMSSLLTVSREAAAMPPSKMGFEAGSQLTLDNALKIIMVKSANDVAWTIAENVGGSVERFVDEMNATARRLGLTETRFTNPSGLPDLRKSTSARDMALLAQALWRDFPSQRDLWGIQSIAFGSTVMNNHNGLIGRYPGATGLKTGYVCSSGFNVVAIAERGGRRLVVVVMGQLSARERTALSASLMEHGFSARGLFGFGSNGRTLRDLPRSARTAPQDFRPIVCDPNRRRDRGEEDAEEIVIAGASQAGAGALAFLQAQRATLPVVDLPERRPVAPIQVSLGLPTGIAPGPAPAGAIAASAGTPLNILPPPPNRPLIDGLPGAPTSAPSSAPMILAPVPPPRPRVF